MWDHLQSQLYNVNEELINVPNIRDFLDPNSITDFPSCQNIEFVDEKIEFKKIIDIFIIFELLQSEKAKYNFLEKIFTVYNYLIESYNQTHNLTGDNAVKFIYKGGNLMRIIKKKYFSNPKLEQIIRLNEQFTTAFSKSDDDFTIKINPELPDFETIYQDMEYISYKGLVIIRQILEISQFDFANLPPISKEMILREKVLDNLREMKCLRDVPENVSVYKGYNVIGVLFGNSYVGTKEWSTINNIIDFIPFTDDTSKPSNFTGAPANYFKVGSKRHDFSVIPSQKNLNSIHMFKDDSYFIKGNTDLPIYLTYNDTLTFRKTTERITSFSLFRAKVNARIFMVGPNVNDKYYVDVGGELIDVSIAKKNDNELNHFYHDKDKMHQYLQTYSFGSSSQNKIFKVDGYTLDYLILDLLRILLPDTDSRPWKDSKYDRRFSRLYTLYLIKILYNTDYDYLSSINYIDQYRKILGQIKRTDPESTFMKELVNDLISLTIDSPISVFYDMTKFVEYLYITYAAEFRFMFRKEKKDIDNCIDQIINNVSLIQIILEHMKSIGVNNTTELGMIDASIITELQLGGKYYRKYLKYKTKYLSLLNSAT